MGRFWLRGRQRSRRGELGEEQEAAVVSEDLVEELQRRGARPTLVRVNPDLPLADRATVEPCVVPLLSRGLRPEQKQAIRRKAATIIDNMCKLVEEPLDAAPFLPQGPEQFSGFLCGVLSLAFIICESVHV